MRQISTVFVCFLLVLPALACAADLGAVRFENTGAPEAQEPFQQGVAALHSFFYDEAADLFRQAQTADPDFALAYWGEALTYDHPLWQQHDRDAAQEALARLAPTREERAALAGTERERAFLDSVEILFADEGDSASRHDAYRDRLRRIHERWPEDPEAAAFYALAIQGADVEGDHVIPARIESAAVLEELHDDHPEHPGVLHYLIHAYDDPVHAPLGLRAARTYAEVAPAAHHALHMPSHIFVQLGMWDRVVASNEDAVAASVDWIERRGHPRDKMDLHSLSWLHYGLLQLGRVAEAATKIETAEDVAEEVGSGRATRTLDSMRARHRVETHGTQGPPELPVGDASGLLEASQVSAAALAAWRRGDAEALEDVAARWADGQDGDRAEKALALQVEGLRLLMTGDAEGAVATLREAAAVEEQMGPPSGPPVPLQPSHELLGEVLLSLDRPAEALEAYEAELQRTPNRSWSLYGAARAEAGLGHDETAEEYRSRLPKAWLERFGKMDSEPGS